MGRPPKGVALGGTPSPRVLALERRGATADGILTLVAFGVRYSSDTQALTTSTSAVGVHFLAEDSAVAVISRVYQALVAHVWTASPAGTARLSITKNGHGDPIYSMWYSVDYFEDPNEDHWVFWGGGE